VTIILLIEFGAVPAPSGIAGVSKASTSSGDLHIGFLEAVDNLNPFIGTTDPSYLLYGLIYDYLFAFDPSGNIIPNLATNATCSDATCQNWTYTIRQNVKWSDGTPFTADDVNFTINYNIANFFQLWAYEPYVNRIVQCSAQTRPYCGAVQISQWQVRVYFDRPFAPGHQFWIPIIQKAQWGKISPSQAQYHFANANPIGTGPYRAAPDIYTEWLNNLPLHLIANDAYHDLGDPNHPYKTGGPSVANIYLHQFLTESSMVSALESGSIQLAKFTSYGYNAVGGQPNIARQEDLEVTQYWNEIGITQYQAPNGKTALNPTRFDIRVRQALAKATNKDYILQAFYGGKGYRGSDLMSYITPQWWYDPVADGTNLTYDLNAAKAQLDQAGYTTMVPDPQGICPNGVRSAAKAMTVIGNDKLSENDSISIPAGTTLTYTMAVRQEFKQEQLTATYLQTNWCKIGVSIITKVEAESALITDVYGPPPSVEMYIWFWSGDPDPNYLLSIQSGYTLDGWSDNYWNNGTYNALYRQQLAELNSTKRQALVQEAQRVHYESAVYIVYIYPYGEWAYRTDCWSNWGDWVTHPFIQMDAFWGANFLFFNLQNTCAPVGPPPTPPTQPTINGQTSGATFSAFANTSFSLVGASTDTNASETLTFYWTFGDGNTSQNSHPNAAGKTIYDFVNKTWTTPSTTPYQMSLSVGDGTTFSVQTVVYVNVSARPSSSQSAWVNGTVTDQAHHPLAGATVTPSPRGAQVQTAASGFYSLLLNATTPTYTITFSKQLYISRNETVSVTAGKTTWLNVSLTENVGWVIGTVKSSAGALISGAAISVSGGGTTYPGVTGTDGQYNVTAAPGTYTVTATKDGYQSGSYPNIVVSLGQATKVDFSLSVVVQPTQPLSPLIIAGVALIVVVVALAVLAVLLTRRRNKKEEAEAKINLPPK
jgi:peptide/nickel transport system substrate-binding protein